MGWIRELRYAASGMTRQAKYAAHHALARTSVVWIEIAAGSKIPDSRFAASGMTFNPRSRLNVSCCE